MSKKIELLRAEADLEEARLKVIELRYQMHLEIVGKSSTYHSCYHSKCEEYMLYIQEDV